MQKGNLGTGVAFVEFKGELQLRLLFLLLELIALLPEPSELIAFCRWASWLLQLKQRFQKLAHFLLLLLYSLLPSSTKVLI